MLRANVDFDPHRCRDINQIIHVWLPLAGKVKEAAGKATGSEKL
jgi:hypothetical protein